MIMWVASSILVSATNFLRKNMTENTTQIYINKKELPYSRPNMISVINSFLPYLTNPDLDKLNDRCVALKEHRQKKEQQSQEEENRTPILSNRYDTPPALEHDQTWGNEYE
jgi:hypothetical protein